MFFSTDEGRKQELAFFTGTLLFIFCPLIFLLIYYFTLNPYPEDGVQERNDPVLT